MKNATIRQLDTNNKEYDITLSLGGRGWREAVGEGELNEKFPKDTPSSVLWTHSPSRGEGNNGFTLIELLVVVLIIGILASVALPQYNIAVEKSRAANVWPLLKAINEAEKRKNLEQDTSARAYSLSDLDLDFSNFKDAQPSAEDGGTDVIHGGSYISTTDFDIGINSALSNPEPAIAVRKSDSYYYALALQNGKKMCMPLGKSTGDPYNPVMVSDGGICQKIVGKTTGISCLTGSTCYTE